MVISDVNVPTIPVAELLHAYASGRFPMCHEDGELWWHDPDPRAIFPLDRVAPNARLQQEVSGPGGGPVQAEVAVFAHLSAAELAALIDESDGNETEAGDSGAAGAGAPDGPEGADG